MDYETGEREELCKYIDVSLEESGIGVEGAGGSERYRRGWA